MTHIAEGTIQAYLDDELLLEERWHTERHLEECELCRRELAAQETRAAGFRGAVERLDGALPAHEHAIGWPRAGRGGELRRMLPRAAVLLLFVGAAASATVPGWPLRNWIEQLVPAADQEVSTAPADQGPAPADAPARAEAGVFVEAADGEVEVVLRDGRDLRVRTVLVDGSRAGVTTVGGAAGARFRTGAGRIEVIDAAGGQVRIEIPRGAVAATVMINGHVVLQKEDSSFDLPTDLPGLDSAGITFSVEQ